MERYIQWKEGDLQAHADTPDGLAARQKSVYDIADISRSFFTRG